MLACALQVWGAAAVPRLVGMYAFVALDLRTRDFLAARDPRGVKPLYLMQEGDRFLFCSEIALLPTPTPAAWSFATFRRHGGRRCGRDDRRHCGGGGDL